jgi:hypothetical protein
VTSKGGMGLSVVMETVRKFVKANLARRLRPRKSEYTFRDLVTEFEELGNLRGQKGVPRRNIIRLSEEVGGGGASVVSWAGCRDIKIWS